MNRDFDVESRQTRFNVPPTKFSSGQYFSAPRLASSANRQVPQSVASKFEKSVAMSSSNIISSYPLSRSYTEAFRCSVHKTFCVKNLETHVISKSVRLWQALPAWCNVAGKARSLP
jgi:hypothetical protein